MGDGWGRHLDDVDARDERAHTHTHSDSEARQADVAASVELAHRQGATLFELRAALDDFELRGEPARATVVDVVGRMPANSAFPELGRAWAALKSTDSPIG